MNSHSCESSVPFPDKFIYILFAAMQKDGILHSEPIFNIAMYTAEDINNAADNDAVWVRIGVTFFLQAVSKCKNILNHIHL